MMAGAVGAGSFTTNDKGDYVAILSNANYTINKSDCRITSIKYLGKELLNQSGYGTGYTLYSNKSYINGVQTPITNKTEFTSIISEKLICKFNSTTIKKGLNITYIFTIKSDSLHHLINITNNAHNNIEIVGSRYSIGINRLSNLEIYPEKTLKDSLDISCWSDVYYPKVEYYFFNATVNMDFALIKPSVMSKFSGYGAGCSFVSTYSSNVYFAQKFLKLIVLKNSNLELEYSFSNGDMYKAKAKHYNYTKKKVINGNWYPIYLTNEASITDEILRDLYYNRSVRYVTLMRWYPSNYRLYTLNGTWTNGGGYQHNLSSIQRIIDKIKSNNIDVYIYINPFENDLNQSIRLFHNDLIQNISGKLQYGSTSNLVILNLENKSTYYQNITKSVKTILDTFTNIDGMYIDRLDYSIIDLNGTKPIFNSTTKGYIKTTDDGYVNFIKNVSSEVHNRNLVLGCQYPISQERQSYCDFSGQDPSGITTPLSFIYRALDQEGSIYQTTGSYFKDTVNMSLLCGYSLGTIPTNSFNVSQTYQDLIIELMNKNKIFTNSSFTIFDGYISSKNTFTITNDTLGVEAFSIYLENNHTTLSRGVITSYVHNKLADNLTDILAYSTTCKYLHDGMNISSTNDICNKQYRVNLTRTSKIIILKNGQIGTWLGRFVNLSTSSRIFNSTSSSYITGKNNHTETIGAGKRLFIAQFNRTKIDDLGLGINSIEYSDKLNRFELNWSGTGNANISGLKYMGAYVIYHNGTFYGFGSGDTASITGSSEWVIESIYSQFVIPRLLYYNGNHFENYKWGQVFRVIPTKSHTQILTLPELNLTSELEQIGINTTRYSVNNLSLRIIEVNQRGECIDQDLNTIWCDTIPFKIK
jgi:hypothetical protein